MIFVYITAGNVDDAKKISRHLLKKRLAACTNIFPIESMYRWDGGIQENIEFGIIVKTVKENYDAIVEEVHKIHTYEMPCVVSWSVSRCNEAYEAWIRKETNRKNKEK